MSSETITVKLFETTQFSVRSGAAVNQRAICLAQPSPRSLIMHTAAFTATNSPNDMDSY
jgi:hypothetical protein